MRFILVIVGESGCILYDPHTNDTMFFQDTCSVAHDTNMNMKLLDEAWTLGEKGELGADEVIRCLIRNIVPRVYGIPGRYRNLELSLWRRRTMQGRQVDRKRNAPTLRFAFSGWNAECLSLFARNPQPSRTLCPSFFKLSSRPCLPSLFQSTTISSLAHPPLVSPPSLTFLTAPRVH